STSQKRRLPRTPPRSSTTSSGCTSPSDLTGAIEMRTTRASTCPRLRGRAVDPGFAATPHALEVEDPEVAAGDMHGDVVDGDLADAALERAGVSVAVQHEVGAVFGDRCRQ